MEVLAIKLFFRHEGSVTSTVLVSLPLHYGNVPSSLKTSAVAGGLAIDCKSTPTNVISAKSCYCNKISRLSTPTSKVQEQVQGDNYQRGDQETAEETT